MQMAAGYHVKKTNPLKWVVLIPFCIWVLGCASVSERVTPQNAMPPLVEADRQRQGLFSGEAPVKTPSQSSGVRDPDFQSLGLQLLREETVKSYLDRLRAQLQLSSRLYAAKAVNPSARLSKFRVLSLPEPQILIIPRAALLSVRYESELAAMIALEFERSLAGFSKIEPLFEPEDQAALQIEVLKRTVRRLYDAGFDPRGLVGFLEGYQNRGLAGRGSIRKDRLNEWMKVIRAELAVLPPLLSPIVRSREFIEIQSKVVQVSP